MIHLNTIRLDLAVLARVGSVTQATRRTRLGYSSTSDSTPSSTRCALMLAAPARDWNVFKQLFVEHWDGFKHAHPRYHTRYYDGLVTKMLHCGNPDKMGYSGYTMRITAEGSTSSL